ncbi:MAG TPA: IS66 family transposase [Vicinamibacterales bacterium]|nr:IS66 family transposase [Vicinamibacterales bacterium]
MAPGAEGETHRCEWRERAEALEAENALLREQLGAVGDQVSTLGHELEALKRRLLGPKSEKLPPIQKELREGQPPDFEAVLKKRRERQKQKAKLDTVTTVYPVAPDKRRCPKCGGTELRPLGEGKVSTLYDYVPARFIAHRQVRETLSCRCDEGIITAEGPARWQEKSRYSPSFVAHVITAKCADSIPLYRLEKEYQRIGVPIARSTMTDMFHVAADLLAPLSKRLLDIIRNADVVHADETSMKVQSEGECRNGFVWTFRTTTPAPLIAYRFSPSRSGETPKQLLGGTTGALVVDGYTGYNAVSDVNGRTRVGCHAHVRRYFFDALATAPEAQRALDLIRELYRVEHAALEAGIVGTSKHLELRKQNSAPIRAALKAWLDEAQAQHPPKSPLGVAIRYTLNQWDVLGRFIDDARVPLDNNPAEAALRRVALGRKNFLFVGTDDAGQNLAGLYSLVATCEANGVNPLAYLADVLVRVHKHPNSRIDELLPHNWRGPPGDDGDRHDAAA